MVLVLYVVVFGINKYNGKYYFLVNILLEFVVGNVLFEMVKKVIKMLFKFQWVGNLVFEFVEDIDVIKDKIILEIMCCLCSMGCWLFLDDCFFSY